MGGSIDHCAAALASDLQRRWPDDVDMADWEDLFEAVTARLGLIGAGPACNSQAALLECVAALEQLHLTLIHELRRSQPPADGPPPMRARPDDGAAGATGLR